MKGIILLVGLLAIAVLVFSFENKNREELASYSEQDSELALLMRYMHDQAKLMRSNVVNAELMPSYNDKIEFVIDATPTKPSVQGPEYEAYARYYIETNKNLFQKGQKAEYNDMVEACVACHKTYCPGPVRTIKKLTIK